MTEILILVVAIGIGFYYRVQIADWAKRTFGGNAG